MSKESITYTSLASLEKDVLQLKECMDIMQETVQLQQVSLDSIEEAIQASKEEVKPAYNNIVVADTYQSNYHYVMAAAGSAAKVLTTKPGISIPSALSAPSRSAYRTDSSSSAPLSRAASAVSQFMAAAKRYSCSMRALKRSPTRA